MATHQIVTTYKSSSGSLTSNSSKTNNTEINFDETVAASTTNHEIDIVLDVSQIVSMCIQSTKAVTIKTNSTSAPDDTFTVADGGMISWNSDSLGAIPLSTDTTKLYITTGSAEAVVTGRFLLDLAP